MLRLSHAYIADGQAVNDLTMAALCSSPGDDGTPCMQCKNCTKVLNQIHPDIITVSRLKNKNGTLKSEIIVDQIRELKSEAYIAPNEAARRVNIVSEAGLMNENAQNAFLQLLEEPPAHVVFILKTSNPAALLPTVRSRCIELKSSGSVSGSFYGKDSDEISQLASDFVNALDDNLKLTQCMFKLDKLDKNAFSDFLLLARERLAKLFHDDPSRKSVFAAEQLLTDASGMLKLNVSTIHVSAMLCTSLIKT